MSIDAVTIFGKAPSHEDPTTHIKDQVSAALCRTNREKFPGFIVQNTDGVFVNVEILKNQESFREFLGRIFADGYYLSQIAYSAVMDLLFDADGLTGYREKTNPLVKIASGIQKFDEQRIPLYRKPGISSDGKTANYPFDPVYIGESTKNKLKPEDRAYLDIDEFIAAMWNQGIRFRLEISSIGQLIQENRIGRYPIAHEQAAIPGEGAKMRLLAKFEKDFSSRDRGDGTADIHTYKQPFVLVKANVPIYQKTPRKVSVPWWDIHGESILAEMPKDINLPRFLWDGVHFETRNGTEYIVSDRSGYLEEEYDQSGALIRVDVLDSKTFEGDIGPQTGNVRLSHDVYTYGDIVFDYKEEGKNLIIKGNVEWLAHANKHVTVEKNVNGTAKGNLLSGEPRRLSLAKNGKVVSDSGNITIKGLANGAYLEAKDGLVRISNAEKSIIIGDCVEIYGNATDCTIVARKLIIGWKATSCRIVSGETIAIRSLWAHKDSENILTLFSLDLTLSIQKLREDLALEEGMVVPVERGIDALIVSALPKATVKNRTLAVRALVKIMADRESLYDKKHERIVDLFKLLKEGLFDLSAQMSIHWGHIANHSVKVATISQQLVREMTTMEGADQKLRIHIQDMQGFATFWRVKHREDKKLLDFSLEEIAQMSPSSTGWIRKSGTVEASPHTMEKLAIPTSGEFHWDIQSKWYSELI